MTNIIIVNTITSPTNGEYYGKIYYNIAKDKLYFKNKANKVKMLGHTRNELIYKEPITKIQIEELINNKILELKDEIATRNNNIKPIVNNLIYQGLWDTNITYNPNNLVHDCENNLYICMEENVNMCPTDFTDIWNLLCSNPNHPDIELELENKQEVTNTKQYIYGYYDGDSKYINVDILTTICIPINYIVSQSGDLIKNVYDDDKNFIILTSNNYFYKFTYNINLNNPDNVSIKIYIKLLDMFSEDTYEVGSNNFTSGIFYYLHSSELFNGNPSRVLLLIEVNGSINISPKQTWLHIEKI